ncbi:MAG: PH domain-containing protein [Haloarculaceae archaeon]
MRRLHPLSAVGRVLRTALQFGALAFFLVVVVGEFVGIGTLALRLTLVPLAVVAGVVYATARYLRFEYAVEGETLVVASGVFDRQERTIPLGRIQNVDLRQGIVQRLFGLAVVTFETAGGSGTEAKLDAVGIDEARRLQRAVERRGREETADTGPGATATAGEQAAGATPPSEPDAAEHIYALSTSDLLIMSAVSIRPAAPALVLFGAPLGDDLALSILSATVGALGGPTDLSPAAVVGYSPAQIGLIAAVALAEFLLAAWLASVVLTVIEYYDFRLSRVGDDLRYERGLLQRYSGTIPLEKVQTVTVRENVLMRPFGYAALAVETAGYGAGNDDQTANTAVPLDDRATVVDLAETLGGVESPAVERPPKRARRRYIVRFSLLPVAVAAVLALVDALAVPIPWWPLVLVGLLVTPVAGHLAWRHRGHAATDRTFAARKGFWRRRTRLVPYYRVQTVVGERTVFQRWRNLASVTADTASSASLLGGSATAHDIDDATARDLHRSLRDRLREDLRRRKGERS